MTLLPRAWFLFLNPCATYPGTISNFQPSDQSGAYPMIPEQYQEQQFRPSPSAPVDYSTSPPLPPAENPYLKNQADGGVQGGRGGAPGGDFRGLQPVLPYGWESKALPDGQILFIDHNSQVSTTLTAVHSARPEIYLEMKNGRIRPCCFRPRTVIWHTIEHATAKI